MTIPPNSMENILRLPILCHDSGYRVGISAQKWNFLSAVFLNTCSRKARHLYGSGYLLNLLICELCVGFVSIVEGMSNSTLFFNGKANCSILLNDSFKMHHSSLYLNPFFSGSSGRFTTRKNLCIFNLLYFSRLP